MKIRNKLFIENDRGQIVAPFLKIKFPDPRNDLAIFKVYFIFIETDRIDSLKSFMLSFLDLNYVN